MLVPSVSVTTQQPLPTIPVTSWCRAGLRGGTWPCLVVVWGADAPEMGQHCRLVGGGVALHGSV